MRKICQKESVIGIVARRKVGIGQERGKVHLPHAGFPDKTDGTVVADHLGAAGGAVGGVTNKAGIVDDLPVLIENGRRFAVSGEIFRIIKVLCIGRSVDGLFLAGQILRGGIAQERGILFVDALQEAQVVDPGQLLQKRKGRFGFAALVTGNVSAVPVFVAQGQVVAVLSIVPDRSGFPAVICGGDDAHNTDIRQQLPGEYSVVSRIRKLYRISVYGDDRLCRCIAQHDLCIGGNGRGKNGRWQVTDKDAFVRKEVEQAVERMAETAKAKGVTYDPSFLGSMDENGKFTIRNEAAYTRLQYETAIIREADAQRPVREISMTQSQDGIKLSNVEGDYKSVEEAAGAIRAEFVDPKTGSPVQRQHIQQPDADSVRYYSGERNVDCRGIRYNESTGNLEVHYQVKNGANIPQLSATIIQDRYKEAGMPVLNGNIRHVIHVHGVSEESIQGQQYMKVFGFEDDCEVVFD